MTHSVGDRGSSFLIILRFVMTLISSLRAQRDWLLMVHLSMPGSTR